MQQAMYRAVIVPDGGNPYLVEASTIVALAEELKTHINKQVCVFPFYGTLLGVTKGSLKTLVYDDIVIPLYELPSTETDPTGSLDTN